ncbi:MAG TPA: HEPN domain-containing protein [Anaerolineales bacterium]|jgi:HEPN domain-containing protein|nr:HEPN domain-containing protein [Anaerolineales bacterium]
MREDDPLAWVEKAEEDWVAANTLLRRKKPFKGIVCFHLQQSAEKYLKAILVLKGSAFPKTHDLTALSKMCEENGILIGMDEDNLDILSGYAATARYPGADPSLNDTRDALQTTKVVRRFARSFLGLKK